MSLCDDAEKAGLSECLPDPTGLACARARAEAAERRLERVLAKMRWYRVDVRTARDRLKLTEKAMDEVLGDKIDRKLEPEGEG